MIYYIKASSVFFLLILSVYSERKTYFCFYVVIVFKDEKLFVSDFSIAVALGL